VVLVVTGWYLPVVRGVLLNVLHVKLESTQTLLMPLNAKDVHLENIQTLKRPPDVLFVMLENMVLLETKSVWNVNLENILFCSKL